jgi:hypothetical protein
VKPASEWALEINARYEYEDDICLARLIERIQADAIEACAKECEIGVAYFAKKSEGATPLDSLAARSAGHALVGAIWHIRALIPTDNTDRGREKT